MTYLAIARKYRPATFDQIVGQDHVTRTLRNALERGRIHHAFLFTGARGVGKTTAARALARSLNCEQGPTATPCGTCLSCREITGGMSPDLIEIDGASNNSVDDIRDLRETVRYAATSGRHKIYLIDEVHMLSKGAFNALLKTLEEPPPHVVFIFATTEPNKIPETILSRVQRFDFKRIPVVGIVERLRKIATSEGATITDEGLRLIARASEGSMRDAQSLLDQVISFGSAEITDAEVTETLGLIDRRLLYDFLGGLITGEPDRCLAVIHEVYGYGYELSQFTSEMLEVLRNATFLRLSAGARRYVDLSEDELARLDELAADADPEALSRTFTAMLEVHDQVSRAGQPRMVLDMAVARLATVRPIEPVADLLKKLEALEQRIRRGGGGAPVHGLQRSATPPPTRARPSEPASRRAERTPSRPAPAKAALPPPAPAKPAPAKPTPAKPTPAKPAPAKAAPAKPPPAKAAPPEAKPAAVETPAPADPWGAFGARISKVKNAEYLSGGTAVLLGEILQVTVSSKRAHAAARKVAASREAVEALAATYPTGTTLTVVTAPSGPRDPADELKESALQDPAVRRIVETLGADLARVTPIDDGESS